MFEVHSHKTNENVMKTEISFLPYGDALYGAQFYWKTYNVALLLNIKMAPNIFEVNGNSERD